MLTVSRHIALLGELTVSRRITLFGVFTATGLCLFGTVLLIGLEFLLFVDGLLISVGLAADEDGPLDRLLLDCFLESTQNKIQSANNS